MEWQPDISVVVPTRNRAHLLPGLLEALVAQQTPGGHEVVVVDDASTDATASLLADLGGGEVPVLGVTAQARRGPAAARNVGWRRARGAAVAFTDDDCIPEPGWLAALLTGLQNADLAQGVTLPDDAGAIEPRRFRRTTEVTHESGFYETCNIAYRRALLESLGGFNESFRHAYGEDVDLAWRAIEGGARTTFVPGARVRHEVRYLGLSERARESERLDGVVLAVKLHPHLRRFLVRGLFYRRQHGPAILAALGVVGATTRRLRWPAAAALVALYAVTARSEARSARDLAGLPAALAGDLVEVLQLARASARHGTLVL